MFTISKDVPKEAGTNVALKSSNGHFVRGAEKVIMMDEKEEAFDVKCKEGKSAFLVTQNHGAFVMDEDFSVFNQKALNPFTEEVFNRID